MKKVKKNAYVYDALRNGVVFKETMYHFPKVSEENRTTEDVKVFMVVAPNKGLICQEDRDFIEKIDVFYNDKDGITLATERGKDGKVIEFTRMNEGAICIIVSKNFKGLFTSKKVLSCVMALNAAFAYYTMHAVGKSQMSHASINACVARFLVLNMHFTPNIIKAALELCAKRNIEAMFKYSKALYKSAKKGGFINSEITNVVNDDDDDEDAEYPDEQKAKKGKPADTSKA